MIKITIKTYHIDVHLFQSIHEYMQQPNDFQSFSIQYPIPIVGSCPSFNNNIITGEILRFLMAVEK